MVLQEYEGRFRSIAEAGVRMGFTIGLLSGNEGLLCLTPSLSDLVPFEQLAQWIGSEVEIFGVLADGTDIPVVNVTVSRSKS